MTGQQEPEFLTREIVDAIHEEQIDTFGGLHGVRDENALESAIAAAQNVYHYGGGDVYEIAAAYGYHLAESQAYFDGNKRTGVQAAFVFLEGVRHRRKPVARAADVRPHDKNRSSRGRPQQSGRLSSF